MDGSLEQPSHPHDQALTDHVLLCLLTKITEGLCRKELDGKFAHAGDQIELH